MKRFLVITILTLSSFMIPAYATDFEVKIPQGAHNRLCATFHNCYSPEEIQIQTGDSISWPNEDSEQHTVTSGVPGKNDRYFDSDLYNPGQSWTFTFNEPGVFNYYCAIHPWMVGKVTVTGEPKTSNVSIPPWIKTNAGWWANDQITDSDFVGGIQFLIEEGLITIPETVKTSKLPEDQKIPSWIKTNAGWWAQDQISDDDFVKGIQYLIEQGIIQVQID
ncbi:MAG: plastocyanin/azurin family copper-binding protein [Nitrosopumilaceae archaeon]